MSEIDNRADALMKLISEKPGSSPRAVVADKLSLLMNEIRLESPEDQDLMRVAAILATLAALLRTEQTKAISAIGVATSVEIQKLNWSE